MFTQEIDSWWKQGPKFRLFGGQVRFEAERMMEGEHQIGKVLTQVPGERLVLELWTWSFRPNERTEVEITFDAIAEGTRVTIVHRLWHERDGSGAEFRTVVGLWWGGLIPAYRSAMA